MKPLKILDAKNIVAFRREHLKTKIPGETMSIPDFFTSETPRGRGGGAGHAFLKAMSLFTVGLSHSHYHVIQRGREVP